MKKFIALTAAFVLALGCTAYAQDKPYKNDILVGDVNDDGKVDAADSADIMQKTLSGGFVLECEKYFNYMGIADIDANGVIDAQDSAMVMQKTLSNAFDMTSVRDKKIMTAYTVFSAAQTSVTDYYARNGKNPPVPTLEQLVEEQFLENVPEGNIKIKLSETADAAVEYVSCDGFVYPDDDFIYGSKNVNYMAATLFSAAQTYVTDYYARYGKEPEKVTVGDIRTAGLITENMSVAYGNAEIVLDERGIAAVDHVVVRGVYYPMSDEEKANNAATIFSAAQTYVTDCYARCAKTPDKVTVDDLVEAKLLTKKPEVTVDIAVSNFAEAAVAYVVYDGIEYPPYENDVKSSEYELKSIYSAAQAYVIDQYKKTGSFPAAVNIDDVVNEGFLRSIPQGNTVVKMSAEKAGRVEYIAYNGFEYPTADSDEQTAIYYTTAAYVYAKDHYLANNSFPVSVTLKELAELGYLSEEPQEDNVVDISNYIGAKIVFNGHDYTCFSMTTHITYKDTKYHYHPVCCPWFYN